MNPTSEKERLEDVSDYHYLDTVFISGNLEVYIKDLEKYFRESSKNEEININFCKKKSRHLERAIKNYEKEGIDSFWWIGDDSRYPFRINKNNYQLFGDWLNERMDLHKKLHKAQRINQRKIAGILLGEKTASELDIINYAYDNHIIRIKNISSEEGNKIRMRVFANPDEVKYDRAQGFAEHANDFEGIDAEVINEGDIIEDIPNLDNFISDKKIGRSKLKVKPPTFEINKKNQLIYSIFLTEADLEILNLFHMFEEASSAERRENLRYGTSKLSPNQVNKVIRNLLGILGIWEHDNTHFYGTWYTDFYIPHQNIEAVQKVKNDGGAFIKKIDKESLPVLDSIFKRTMKLKKQYGNNFYPRFTVKEVSERSGLDKKRTQMYLEHLVGILAETGNNWIFENSNGSFYTGGVAKWFIPKSRIELTNNILNDL